VSLTLTTALKNTILDSGIQSVFNSGTLQIRSGAAPGANAVATGTLLASISMTADAFAAAASGAVAKNGTWSDTSADGTGTAAHFRLITSTDTNASTQNEARLEGSVTATGGGGDLTLDNTSITTGQSVTVNTFSIGL